MFTIINYFLDKIKDDKYIESEFERLTKNLNKAIKAMNISLDMFACLDLNKNNTYKNVITLKKDQYYDKNL